MDTITTNNNFEQLCQFLADAGDAVKIQPSKTEAYQRFITRFPKQRLRDLSLAEYCMGGQDRSSFCWWLERGLQPVLGRYAPGNARGHILYFFPDGTVYKHRLLNELSDEEALRYTLKIHAAIAEADLNQDLGWIDDDKQLFLRAGVEPRVTLGDGRKLRMIACYHPDDFLPISSSEHLAHFLTVLGCMPEAIPSADKPVARSLLLYTYFQKALLAIPEITPFGFMRALYNPDLGLSPPPRKNDFGNEAITSMTNEFEDTESAPLNQILFGPPGTGKTFNTVNEALRIIEPNLLAGNREKLTTAFNSYVAQGRIVFCTFHQSFSYEDFVEGLKAKTNDGQLEYWVEDGIFKSFCLQAERVGKNEKSPFVLIIDEINRGNISKIFGELITLIEPSKRVGAEEALEVTLPYSKKPFSVPDYVYIIGTMNTSDRSLSGLDIALRRRFIFKETPPKPELLAEIIIEGINIAELLNIINARIEILLDRDHCLGHAYFMTLNGDSSITELAAIFQKQILPLLQEYFFEDWQRIQWVLNDHRKTPDNQFITRKSVGAASNLFGADVPISEHQLPWTINQDAFNRVDAYTGIIQAGA